jgi:Cu2+-exporting ATPase
MMCHHCENAVKSALEALPQVTEAIADHEAGIATITLTAPVEEEVLQKAIADEDYELLEIQK